MMEGAMEDQQERIRGSFGLLWSLSVAVGAVVAYFLALLLVGLTLYLALSSRSNSTLLMTLVGLAAVGGVMGVGASLGPALLLRRKGISVLRWIGATVAAAIIGAMAIINTSTSGGMAAAVTAGLSIGLPVGIAQMMVLQREQIRAYEWVVVNVLAVGMATLLVGLDGLSGFAAPLLYGVITGLAMVWLLRRHERISGQISEGGASEHSLNSTEMD